MTWGKKMTDFKTALTATALIAMAAWGFYTAGLKSQRDRLAAELAAAVGQTESLRRELELGRLALERREAERRRLTNEKDALMQALQEVYADDEKARGWADAPCPDGVLDCLLGPMPAGAAD